MTGSQKRERGEKQTIRDPGRVYSRIGSPEEIIFFVETERTLSDSGICYKK